MISNICTTGVGAADEVEVNPLNAVFFLVINRPRGGEKMIDLLLFLYRLEMMDIYF